jgi:hypothetical protein
MPDDIAFELANFKKNSYIIIEDQEESSEFFIIKQGKVLENRSASTLESDTLSKIFNIILHM